MSDIKYVRSHALPIKQAKAVAQKTADDLAKEYDLVSEWQGDVLHFHRSGVEGHMKVTADKIALDVTLGFLLKPFRHKFEHHIEHHLDELLAGSPEKPAKAAKAPAAKPAARARKA
jgi:putative polyhydroxyalkanoate system protein